MVSSPLTSAEACVMVVVSSTKGRSSVACSANELIAELDHNKDQL